MSIVKLAKGGIVTRLGPEHIMVESVENNKITHYYSIVCGFYPALEYITFQVFCIVNVYW